MGEFLNNYVLKSREDNGRCDVLAIFTDLIYVDVDEDKPFGPKLIKNEETRPNNNLISLSFWLSFFLSFLFFIVRSWTFCVKILHLDSLLSRLWAGLRNELGWQNENVW